MGDHTALKRPGATLLPLFALHSLVCAARLSLEFVQFSSPVAGRPTIRSDSGTPPRLRAPSAFSTSPSRPNPWGSS